MKQIETTMQVAKPPIDEDRKARIEAQKELVEALKVQWKLLWTERFDDNVRAEGVSMNDYSVLQVERGAVIHATKDFKALSLKEIIKQNINENPEIKKQPKHQFKKTGKSTDKRRKGK